MQDELREIAQAIEVGGIELDDSEQWGQSLRSDEIVAYFRSQLHLNILEVIDERRPDDPLHESMEALAIWVMTEQRKSIWSLSV